MFYTYSTHKKNSKLKTHSLNLKKILIFAVTINQNKYTINIKTKRTEQQHNNLN